ncbi:MAG: RRXRR domain-containing protein [Deltaproteobacteria bacterium]|nr:RRXRR domain-containing protein [Deltaproteobacteria bacterium]
MITLGIDYGASNIGIALVRNTESGNEPLFAGTIKIDVRDLKDKVETRASIRRVRRTRKTKKRRLRNLASQLAAISLDKNTIDHIVRFSRRRGYKSLFDEGKIHDSEFSSENELTYRFSREDFFLSLEEELHHLILDPEIRAKAIAICEQVLNKEGDRQKEVRLIRIDNRGVSRCAWEGCTKVTPRTDNALHDPIAQQLYTVFQKSLLCNADQISNLKTALAELHVLAKRIRAAPAEKPAKERKTLRAKTRKILRSLKEKFYNVDGSLLDEDQGWSYIEKGILNIMEKGSGRNRYCQKHSKEYIETILKGQAVPFKKTIADSDIVSRREQIVYQKLWRYIEARVVPLADGHIGKIVVERSAFDLLAGARKTIRNSSDKYIEDLYQQGPMYGFKSRREMLAAEFDGLCVYCGKKSSSLMDHDHILPHADFFFDGYLNILPACSQCNSALKGKRSLTASSLQIVPEAYEAYSNYLKKKYSSRPPHFLHTVKKGILNLMQDKSRLWEAEQYLSLIARQYAQIVQTQRSPRPFARYLYTRLVKLQGTGPAIQFQNGRHTALYRTVAYPEFDKQKEKLEGKTSNHALDALVLASALPSIYSIEAINIPLSIVKSWTVKVKNMAPSANNGAGIPTIPRNNSFVKGFEHVDPHGYVEVEMRSMVWNQKDRSTHKQDPYGEGSSEKYGKCPTKRRAAVDLCNHFKTEKSDVKIEDLVERIHHTALRKTIKKQMEPHNKGESASNALRKWLQESVQKSLPYSSFSNNPGDTARQKELRQFASSDETPIPTVIGVKMFDTGVRGKVDLERIDRHKQSVCHRYMTDPPNTAVIIAYPSKSNARDGSKPCCLFKRQNGSIKPEALSIFEELPSCLSVGKKLGHMIKPGASNIKAVEQYLGRCGFHSYAILTPGCVIHYEDGSLWFVRNFDQSNEFKKSRLRNIANIRRHPYSLRMIPLGTL